MQVLSNPTESGTGSFRFTILDIPEKIKSTLIGWADYPYWFVAGLFWGLGGLAAYLSGPPGAGNLGIIFVPSLIMFAAWGWRIGVFARRLAEWYPKALQAGYTGLPVRLLFRWRSTAYDSRSMTVQLLMAKPIRDALGNAYTNMTEPCLLYVGYVRDRSGRLFGVSWMASVQYGLSRSNIQQSMQVFIFQSRDDLWEFTYDRLGQPGLDRLEATGLLRDFVPEPVQTPS